MITMLQINFTNSSCFDNAPSSGTLLVIICGNNMCDLAVVDHIVVGKKNKFTVVGLEPPTSCGETWQKPHPRGFDPTTS